MQTSFRFYHYPRAAPGAGFWQILSCGIDPYRQQSGTFSVQNRLNPDFLGKFIRRWKEFRAMQKMVFTASVWSPMSSNNAA